MLKNRVLMGLTYTAIGGIFVSACFMDCGSYVPYICLAVNLAWLGLFVLANRGSDWTF